jgi:hypothetical protein
MRKYRVVALLGGCLYVAGSVWLVRSEGQAFRASMRQGGPVSRLESVETVHGLNLSENTKSAEMLSSTSLRAHQDPAGKSGPGADTSSPAAAASEKTIPSPPPSKSEGSPPMSSGRLREGPDRPLANEPPAPPGLVLDPFWREQALTEDWKLDSLTTADEIRLGSQLHDVIVRSNPRSESGLRRVTEAAKPLLKLRARKEIEYTFTVLDSDIPNAFSHPGGYIYISRALLDMIADEEDYVLEFLIGHEIGHVELQDAVQSLRDRGLRKYKDGTLWKLYFVIIPHAYPKTLEFAADAWAYRHMKLLRRSEHDCFAFLRKIDSYAKANGFDDGRGKIEDLLKKGRRKTDDISTISPIENHLRAHPSAWERLDELKKLRDQSAGLTK